MRINFLVSLPVTIYFNFKHFPFRQAIKLPVFLCMPKILGKGHYSIEGAVRTGMIKLGFPLVSVYKRKGIVLENNGKVVFKGSACLGGNSGIAVGEKGSLIFGDKFSNLTGGKFICYHSLIFGKAVRVGWNTFICDTDFHTLKTPDGSFHTKGFGPIKIEDEVWIGSYCKILKNVVIPSRCTVATGTILTKKVECEPYSLIYNGGGIKVKQTGLYRDIEDDLVNYEET